MIQENSNLKIFWGDAPIPPWKAHAFGACLLMIKSSASLSLKLSIYAVVNCNLTLGSMQISICINRGFQLISVSIYITISMVASQNNHKGQIYNGTASPTLVKKDCWSVYEYTPCQLMLLSFALGYMYRAVKTSRKENDL